MIVRGLLDVFIFYRELDDPETEGKFFVADAEKIFKKEIVYACEGLLSDNPKLKYYSDTPFRVDKDTGFEWFRCFRTTSPLEGYHLHLRAAQAATAKGAGPRYEISRSNLFDFAWNLNAAMKAGKMKKIYHYQPWLIDILARMLKGTELLDVCSALVGWKTVDTTVPPVTLRGIDRPQLALLQQLGGQAVELATLSSDAEVQKILQYPELVARGDAAGIARRTGVRTSAARLKQFALTMTRRAAMLQALKALDIANLHRRLYGRAERPMRSAAEEEGGGGGGAAATDGGALPLGPISLGGGGPQSAVVGALPPPPPPPPRRGRSAGPAADDVEMEGSEEEERPAEEEERPAPPAPAGGRLKNLTTEERDHVETLIGEERSKFLAACRQRRRHKELVRKAEAEGAQEERKRQAKERRYQYPRSRRAESS